MPQANEEMNKSIDLLIDDLFAEDNVEKSIDIAKDADTKADDAVANAPKAQDDAARGAGRPKQISDVPKTDMDGKRESEYDASITENEGKEDQPDEVKKQSKAIDQVSKEGHPAGESKAPKVRPFRKSEDGENILFKSESGEEVELSADLVAEVVALRKSKAEAAEAEKLQKAKDEQNDLIKSAVAEALAPMKEENDKLQKAFDEQAKLLKSMSEQPVQSKSITGIEQLEKSVDPENTEPESFTKSEMKDAAFELAKSGEISDDVCYEMDMTGTISDQYARARIEKYLQTGK